MVEEIDMKKIVAFVIVAGISALCFGIDIPLETKISTGETNTALRLWSMEPQQTKQEDGTYSWSLVQPPEILNQGGEGVRYRMLVDAIASVSASRDDLNATAVAVGYPSWENVPIGIAPQLATKTLVVKYAEVLGQGTNWIAQVLSTLQE